MDTYKRIFALQKEAKKDSVEPIKQENTVFKKVVDKGFTFVHNKIKKVNGQWIYIPTEYVVLDVILPNKNKEVLHNYNIGKQYIWYEIYFKKNNSKRKTVYTGVISNDGKLWIDIKSFDSLEDAKETYSSYNDNPNSFYYGKGY